MKSSQNRLLRTLSSRQSSEPVADWLSRVLAALPHDGEIDDRALEQLMWRVNGHLGDGSRLVDEDPDAHLRFWRAVSERLTSHPLAQAAYADTMLLTGDTPGAVREMLAAFERDPRLIHAVSGDYGTLMRRAGEKNWVQYRALAIRAAELHDPAGNAEYVVDEVRDLLDDIGEDPELRAQALRVLGGRT